MNEIKPIIKGKFVETQDCSEGARGKIYYGSRKIIKEAFGTAKEGKSLLSLRKKEEISDLFVKLRENIEERRENIEKITHKETGIPIDAVKYDMDFAMEILKASLHYRPQISAFHRGGNLEFLSLFRKEPLIIHPSFFPPFSWLTKFVSASLLLFSPVIIIKEKFPFHFPMEIARALAEIGFPSFVSFIPLKIENQLKAEITQPENCPISFYIETLSEEFLAEIINLPFPLWPRIIYVRKGKGDEIIRMIRSMEIEISEENLKVFSNRKMEELSKFLSKENEKIVKGEECLFLANCSLDPPFSPVFCIKEIESESEIDDKILIVYSENKDSVLSVWKSSEAEIISHKRILYHLSPFSEIQDAIEAIGKHKYLIL